MYSIMRTYVSILPRFHNIYKNSSSSSWRIADSGAPIWMWGMLLTLWPQFWRATVRIEQTKLCCVGRREILVKELGLAVSCLAQALEKDETCINMQ